jgi:hypothetical protein
VPPADPCEQELAIMGSAFRPDIQDELLRLLFDT